MADMAFSDKVTFRTNEPAPSDFNAWTFFWTMPEIDDDATLEIVVLEPDGSEHWRHRISSQMPAGHNVRSDFIPDFAGGDPSVFWNKHVVFSFYVDKGSIAFQSPESCHFSFRKENDIAAVMES